MGTPAMNRSPVQRDPAADDEDPRPVAPPRPSSADCCRGGCDPCVFDLYDAALEQYEAALRAWRERQKNKPRRAPWASLFRRERAR